MSRRYHNRLMRLERVYGTTGFCARCKNEGWGITAESFGDDEPYVYHGTGCPDCGRIGKHMIVIQREGKRPATPEEGDDATA